MHQTTIRFGSDLWETLAVAAAIEGVSVAQYVRESAVERLSRTGTPDLGEPVAATDRRRDARAPRRVARVLAAGPGADPSGLGLPSREEDVAGRPGVGGRRADLRYRGVAGRRASMRHAESSAAVWAQSRLARARSQELRAASRALIASRDAARGPGTPELVPASVPGATGRVAT